MPQYDLDHVDMIADNNLVIPIEEDPMPGSSSIITLQQGSAELLWGRAIVTGPGQRTDSGELIENPVMDGDLVLYYKKGMPEVTVLGDQYLIVPLAAIALHIPHRHTFSGEDEGPTAVDVEATVEIDCEPNTDTDKG